MSPVILAFRGSPEAKHLTLVTPRTGLRLAESQGRAAVDLRIIDMVASVY